MTIVKMKFVWIITWKLIVSGGSEPLVGENENLVGRGFFFSGCGGISFGGLATEIVWTRLISCGGKGVEPLTKFPKRGALQDLNL